MSVRFTRHAQARVNQRGFFADDVELIWIFGTEVSDHTNEVYLLRGKDIDEARRHLKRTLQKLEKLEGCAAVMSGDEVITVYHATEKAEKKLLKRGCGQSKKKG